MREKPERSRLTRATDKAEERRGPDRRKALKLIGSGMIAVPVADVAASYVPLLASPSDSDLEKSIADVETQHAKYAILYNLHSFPAVPALANGRDALILEWNFDYSNQTHTSRVVENEVKAFRREYSRLFQRAAQMKMPVYFVDSLTFQKGKERSSNSTEAMETVVAGFIALAAPEVAYVIDGGKGVSRRKIVAGSMLAGATAYLGSNVPKEVSQLMASRFNTTTPDESGVARKVEKIAGTIGKRIHPETRTKIIDGRDALIAQKSETIAEILGRSLGRKPRLGICIGANHFGIENELQKSAEKRIAAIKRYFAADFSKEGTIARVDWKEGGGTIRPVVSLVRDPAFEIAQ